MRLSVNVPIPTTKAYFDFKKGKFLKDYESAFPGLPTMYHVEDNWANYDVLKPLIDERFAAWKKKKG